MPWSPKWVNIFSLQLNNLNKYLLFENGYSVFPGEACDDLGGEFCEPKYQEGVY